MSTARLERILRADPVFWRALTTARSLALPDWWIVSGAVYNSVWNALTDRQHGYGIKDIDLFYFDPDTSWDAEDRIIRKAATVFDREPPVEVRNQARVHLWFEDRFGFPIAPLTSCRDSIRRFAALTHAIGVRLTPDDRLTVFAPYGLAAIFDMRMVPNPGHPNRTTYEAKADRCKALWPEISVTPWRAGPGIRRAGPDTDWETVLDLLKRAFAGMEGRIDPPSSLHRLDTASLAAKGAQEICLLAYEGSCLSGCVFCDAQGDALYISKLATLPEAQGRGIARALLTQAETHARTRGLTRLRLQTRVELTENHEAFRRLGFARVGTSSHPGYDRPTSVTMEKPLAVT